MELMVQEGGFLIKTLTAYEEMEQGFRLRHEVFSEELKWAPVTEEGTEVDSYDGFASGLGVFDRRQGLLGYARFITAPHPFMIDKEFAGLTTDEQRIQKSKDMAEITRLCVQKKGRKADFLLRISNLLYKGIYLWSMKMGIRHLVMVVDKRYYRLWRLTGFPVKPVGNFKVMPDSVQAAVLSLDLKEFKEVAEDKKPEFFGWISTQPDHVPSPGLSHGLY